MFISHSRPVETEGSELFYNFCLHQLVLALGLLFSAVIMLLLTLLKLPCPAYMSNGCWALQLYFNVTWLQGKPMPLLHTLAPSLQVCFQNSPKKLFVG